LVHRRAIILAIVGSTSSDNLALKGILINDYLFTVRSWLHDILEKGIGGTDLLLHLLDNIADLPVSKEMVTSSKIGKSVAAIEKDKICVGSPNENAIRNRVSQVKEKWSASVKRMKKAAPTSSAISSSESFDSFSMKRARDADSLGTSPAKKSKSSSLSSLLQQVSSASKEEEELSAAEKARKRAQEKAAEVRARLAAKKALSEESDSSKKSKGNSGGQTQEASKKQKVKWADMAGGPLTIAHGGSEAHLQDQSGDGHDWSDKKKKDKLREKELMQRAKRSRLLDENDSLDSMAMMYSSKWSQPKTLPPEFTNPPVHIDSNELNTQMKRVLSTLPINFLTDDDVPNDPTPLSEVEQALDITAQSTSVPEKIVFIKPKVDAVPLPVPQAAPAIPASAPLSVPPPAPSQPGVATANVVQSLGLPPFLVGQNIQALQTLAASPGLLNSFVDAFGNYDQMKILNLVQTLTATITGGPATVPPPQPQAFPNQIGAGYSQQFTVPPPAPPFQVPPPPPPPPSLYTAASTPAPAPATTYSVSTGEGNLHLSGYGPMTTPESIIQLFSPYVKVDEIVPKNGFMFVNTSDPEGAQRAKEALSGVMVGGGPLRINPAVRRAKAPDTSTSISSSVLSTSILPRNALGQIDYDSVRDDRGNVATRNLFVAGYGPGTTEQMLRDAFSKHTVVTAIVQKATFSFVNTSDRESAVHTREAMTGQIINGGALRINFAKETGRLGTTFDNGVSGHRIQAPIQTTNYYGRYS
jgi:hypothetical protein